MKLLHTLNSDNISSCTFNIGAHTVKEVGHINYMWLLSCILNNGLALSLAGCKHDINSCTN